MEELEKINSMLAVHNRKCSGAWTQKEKQSVVFVCSTGEKIGVFPLGIHYWKSDNDPMEEIYSSSFYRLLQPWLP